MPSFTPVPQPVSLFALPVTPSLPLLLSPLLPAALQNPRHTKRGDNKLLCRPQAWPKLPSHCLPPQKMCKLATTFQSRYERMQSVCRHHSLSYRESLHLFLWHPAGWAQGLIQWQQKPFNYSDHSLPCRSSRTPRCLAPYGWQALKILLKK